MICVIKNIVFPSKRNFAFTEEFGVFLLYITNSEN